MKNIAPEVFRQRLLIEGFYTIDLSEQVVADYLRDLAGHLNLRIYGEPIVHSPVGLGKKENQGYDAFVPLVDSGIAVYLWSEAKFFSVVIFSCKPFDAQKAVDFSRVFFESVDEPVHRAF